MSEIRAAEEALARQASAAPVVQLALGKTLNSKVVALSGRLPQIWADDATTDAYRKALLRCLIEKIVLDRGERDVALVRIVWRGGAVTKLEVKMKVNSVAKSRVVEKCAPVCTQRHKIGRTAEHPRQLEERRRAITLALRATDKNLASSPVDILQLKGA